MSLESTFEEILLIEDNDIDVELVRRLTRRMGLKFPIRRARNGLEALEILKEPDENGLVKPYLILLDINMPMMSGFELLEYLSKNGPDIDMPIYILSTSESTDDRDKAQRYSVAGYLVKPINKTVLNDLLLSASE